jgi:hypothetical protein
MFNWRIYKPQTGKIVNSASSISQQTQDCFLHTRAAEHLNIPDQKKRQTILRRITMREDAMQRKVTRIWYCRANVVLQSKNILYEENNQIHKQHKTRLHTYSISPRIKIFTAFTAGSSNTSCTSVQKIGGHFPYTDLLYRNVCRAHRPKPRHVLLRT